MKIIMVKIIIVIKIIAIMIKITVIIIIIRGLINILTFFLQQLNILTHRTILLFCEFFTPGLHFTIALFLWHLMPANNVPVTSLLFSKEIVGSALRFK